MTSKRFLAAIVIATAIVELMAKALPLRPMIRHEEVGLGSVGGVPEPSEARAWIEEYADENLIFN